MYDKLGKKGREIKRRGTGGLIFLKNNGKKASRGLNTAYAVISLVKGGG